ncbi:MAG: M1 family metallopeptidase [Candidatus Andeanibacterium colombiense]|uniref:Aminopeptidase n=1 Tax=Candidatus Andeanibacterium colombiense TaxID=3121345 RepID=A0AAJ6BLF2_9SPHN|nr:MAG: M1 family metallopeptidase [Sphingomonadaceae bacterium]
MRVFPSTLFAALLLAGCASVPQGTASTPAPTAQPLAASVTSDLPRIARPLHYAIDIVPDAQKLTFAGTSSVDLEVYEATDTLTLQALELDIASARLLGANGAGPARALSIRLDRESQTVKLGTGDRIAPGTYRIEFRYTGKINTQANGLFALDYPDKRTGQTVRALFSQFEAPDARRFAPMFDEPSYKATFDLSATVPAGQLALGNMPVAAEQALPGGLKKVTFRTTPKMSSYLLFFGAGEFERLSKPGPGGVELGIVSASGSGEQARYALDALPPLISYYTDYFGVPYPLPKLDNIAAPGESQFFGAMENWGAILSFEKGLLLDPKITSPSAQNYIYVAQAHEVAHQWFGDIVTMAWWNDLWLNEGFASWMETKATDHFNPGWYALLSRVGGREAAMGLDGYAATHPVVQPIRTAEEANSAFDSISYSKGEAVIAMLEAYAGEDVWRDGIRSYIAAHRYSNTTSDDLWNAVEQAGAKGITQIAHDFTLQPGVPLVRAEMHCSGGQTMLSLTQSEFSRDRAAEVAASPQRWRVPLLVETPGAKPQRQVLDGSASLTLPGCGAVVVNGGQLGYFRTLYTPEMIGQLVAALPTLSPIDQIGLVRDNYALAQAGYQNLAPALNLLAAVPQAANPVVAEGAVERWGALYDLASEADKPRLAALARSLWLPRLQQLGFDPKASESLVDTSLRGQLLATFGDMGEPSVVAEARRRFDRLAQDPHSLDGPLKTTWLAIIARNASAAEWDRLAAMAAGAPSAVERQAYYALLGKPVDKLLAQKALDLALTGQAGTSSARIIDAVSDENADLAYDFALANRAKVENLLDSGGGKAEFIAGLGSGSHDPAMIGKLEALLKAAPDAEKRPIEAKIAALRQKLASDPRMAEQAGAWLAAR